MSSSVFFRFKSQKEPSRVAFDGTGISVFELKREIIIMNRLGDGTDFELIICSEDTNEGEFCHDAGYAPLEAMTSKILTWLQNTTMIPQLFPARPLSLRRDFHLQKQDEEVLQDMYRVRCLITQEWFIEQRQHQLILHLPTHPVE